MVRPLTSARASFSRARRVRRAGGSSGGTTTASGVGARSKSVPSRSSSSAARAGSGGLAIGSGPTAVQADVVERMLEHRHGRLVLQHPAAKAGLALVAVGDLHERGRI